MSLSIRVTATKIEIDRVLHSLNKQGFRWQSNGKYYPQTRSTREEENLFSCYLNNVMEPVAPTANNEPQPRPWDAVLGGQDEQEQ